MVAFVYFLATVAFLIALKAMANPARAVQGMRLAGAAMVLAVVATWFVPELKNKFLMLIALALGGVIAWHTARRAQMTEMPQMVALYNGLGGGAAAAIAAVELLSQAGIPAGVGLLAALGAVIGAVAFSGSVVAWAKLDGRLARVWRLARHNDVVALLALLTIGLGAYLGVSSPVSGVGLLFFFLLALALGAMLTLPIGGADMPVVISLLNAFTGLAVGFEGFVLDSPMLIVAGTVVGASGTLLTALMAKAMNRPLKNVLFAPISGEAVEAEGNGEIAGRLKEYSATDAAAALRFAQKVIVVPGYGMAVAGAQHKVWELAQLLEEAGVEVKFAIHPVAGRMPGHMNVLLAEAGVPYEKIFDLEEINDEFAQTDVALVIGANDVVNPAARTNRASPIYGMPILNVDVAREVIVIKRGQGRGYSGVENELFYRDNCHLVYGHAQEVVAKMIAEVKALSV